MGGRLVTRVNNFDVLRLAAATLVLVSHAWALSGRREPGFPGTHETLGFVGVLIFFAISGFLVCQSWTVDPRPVAFAWKRALRIVPGLLVSVVATAYVLGPIITNESATRYLTSPDPVHYVVANTTMLLDYSLPGVFTHNPSSTVNGSLGTLPVEVKAYVLLLLAGLLLVVARRWRPVVIGALVVAGVVSLKTGVKDTDTVVRLFALFAGAAAYYLLRERLILRWWLFAAAVAVWIASYHVPFAAHALLMAVSLPYAVLFLGFRWLDPLRPLTKPGDVSYGIYIYAFVVEQTVVEALHPAPLVVVAVALPVTYLLAFASWRLVEHPALRQKRRLARPATRQEHQDGTPGQVGVAISSAPRSSPTLR